MTTDIAADGLTAFLQDPALRHAPLGEFYPRMMTRYVLALPDLFANEWELPVTYRLLAQAQLKFLQYCLEQHIIDEAMHQLPIQGIGRYSRDELVDTMARQLRTTAEELQKLVDGYDDYLVTYDVTDKQLLFDFEHFTDVVRDKLQAGITLGELLTLQPGPIVIYYYK
jgi:hypothetical protein